MGASDQRSGREARSGTICPREICLGAIQRGTCRDGWQGKAVPTNICTDDGIDVGGIAYDYPDVGHWSKTRVSGSKS